MRKIEDAAAFLFIIAVAILSVVSVLGVWDFFNHDVITKSFETLGLLAVVAVVVMVAGKFIEGRSQQSDQMLATLPNPTFKSIRQITLAILIISVSFLAILGVLAIWQVISDKDTLYKALSSVGILAFTSFIIVMTALEREGNYFMNKDGKGSSVGGVVVVLVILYVLFMLMRGF